MKTHLFTLIMILLAIGVMTRSTYAQNGSKTPPKFEFLKGLRKAQEGEMNKNQQITLDGESIPVYDNTGKRLKGFSLMKAFTSGDFAPDFYIDNDKEIKAILMREATDEEKAQMKIANSDALKSNKKLNEPAPNFEATDLKNNELYLKKLKGKVIVLNFWFKNCKPCAMEIPDLNKLVEKYQGKEVVFIAFALDKPGDLESFLKETPFKYQIVAGARSIADEYNVHSFPTHIIINQDSKIIYKATGLTTNTVENLDHVIEEELKS
ncbi:Peroxiredoxin [Zhouia amylolytica]|uniref:Thioredoxin domain-containing protein n=2 Tax=Zhouia amylolytica TaxID=376730 RepID=W2UMS3_9FLAO|nr:TlpA disulfide reductase family protein [Zhouia amylolytica]ETN95249.1 hypothetical protein P278_09710 [Zhouia amylolytica AD3]SFT14446.1 Peroxiredoxin [Zhouia amylolytica]